MGGGGGRKLQARAKWSAFEYENKASRESNDHTKRLNWLWFKEAPLSPEHDGADHSLQPQ